MSSDSYPCPYNFAPQTLAKSAVLDQACNVEGFTVYSTNVAQQWVFVFDATAVPANGTVPLFAFQVPATDSRGVYFGSRGRNFYSGVVLANSTSGTSFTAGAADCVFDVQYDPVRG